MIMAKNPPTHWTFGDDSFHRECSIAECHNNLMNFRTLYVYDIIYDVYCL